MNPKHQTRNSKPFTRKVQGQALAEWARLARAAIEAPESGNIELLAARNSTLNTELRSGEGCVDLRSTAENGADQQGRPTGAAGTDADVGAPRLPYVDQE